MKMTAINGSPKAADSTSAKIIEQMERILGEQIEAHHAARLVQGETPPETIAAILEADILLIVFPLYVDSLPTPLIELLARLERAACRDISRSAAGPQVFAIVNCGFYEAAQNTLALDMIEYFARRAGLPWGYGIGNGAGPMLASMGDNWAKGPASSVYRALCDMAADMHRKVSNPNAGTQNTSKPNVFVGPKFPRFMYKTVADLGMRLSARRNKTRNLRARPYKQQG